MGGVQRAADRASPLLRPVGIGRRAQYREKLCVARRAIDRAGKCFFRHDPILRAKAGVAAWAEKSPGMRT